MSADVSHFVVGGDGQLGRSLAGRLRAAGDAVIATTRRPTAALDVGRTIHLDLADPGAVDRLAWPDGVRRVYLLAAVTSLRACREDPAGSRWINTTQVSALASLAGERGAVPVLVSTNLVFDGRTPRREPTDPVCPETEYGRQKADAERGVLDAGGVVVRPTKVLPPEPALLAAWREALRRGEKVEAFGDLWLAPVALDDVLEAVVSAAPGVTHISAAEDIRYADAARHVARRIGADPALVRESSAADAGIPAQERPRHTTLRCDRPVNPWRVIDAALGLNLDP